MGGVGAGPELPYAWMMRNCISVHGQWMYPRDAATRMVALVRADLVKLEDFSVTPFALEDVNEAVTHAAQNAGPFKMTIVRPVMP